MRHREGAMPTDSELPPALRRHVPRDAELVYQAPGRANLIGEHTDYNEGFVLPAALEMRTVVAGRRSERIRLRSVGHGASIEVDPRTGAGPHEGWGRYVTAVVRALLDEGRRTRGVEGVIASTVPAGTGLSSSAALEVSVALAVLDEPIDEISLARVCQRAENVYVGVRSGIMDQLASVGSREGSALFIDCRSFETADVPIAPDLRLAVIDSGQRRELSAGDYNRRREECEEAARLLGVASLRDVTAEQLRSASLPERIAARARHVVGENARVLQAADALRADDRARIGELFAASHASLARDFEVSTDALDALVEIARNVDGVVGARMTGAGFGGCTINLVEAGRADAAVGEIVRVYEEKTGRIGRGWVSKVSSGAALLGAFA